MFYLKQNETLIATTFLPKNIESYEQITREEYEYYLAQLAEEVNK